MICPRQRRKTDHQGNTISSYRLPSPSRSADMVSNLNPIITNHYKPARGELGLRDRGHRRWPSAQSKHVGANWPQESLYFFQSPSIALAISLAAERNQFDFLRRRSLRMLATWRLLPK